MAVRVDDSRDIQGAYEDRFKNADDLRSAENQSSDSYDDANHQQDRSEKQPEDISNSIRNKEESADSGYINNFTGGKKTKNRFSAKNLKKAGPIGLIITVMISVAGVVSFFGGPGMLVVNFVEVLTEKFNYQLGSIESRHQKIVKAKLKNTTTGVCSVVNVRCKYATFSDKELKNLKKAGFEVDVDSKTKITGRNKINSLKLPGGEAITAENFSSEMKKNSKFNAAMKQAYSMKFSSMSDKVFHKVAKKFGVSKKAPFEDGVDDKKRKLTIEENTKSGKVDTTAAKVCDEGNCSDEEKKRQSEANGRAKEAQDLTEGSAKSGSNLADDVIEDNAEAIAKGAAKSASGTAAKTALSAVKITGPIDNACMVYGWVKTISYVAKTLRHAQMIRYAMTFLTTASMIKAGTAKPDDVRYLGEILTKVVVNGDGVRSKSATDSFGFRYAAYGDSGIDAKASTAVAGANFGGKIQGTIDYILSQLGSRRAADETCHLLANPIVQVGSLVAGAISFFFGVGEAKLTFQLAMAPLIAVASAILPAMIGDLLAGRLVDDKTYGERSGNLITSGTGGMLSKVAGFGGNSILKKDEARAYMQVQREAVLSYAEYDRQRLSPFDISSPNTFLGSIYTQFLPYVYSGSTPMNILSSFSSIVSKTAKNFVSPPIHAATKESYSECSDPYYKELGIATDPFCNPVVGIPPQYLSAEPEAVIDRLTKEHNAIDENSGNPSSQEYKDFVKNCIERDDPFGASQADEVDKSSDCFIDSQFKADMYVHYVDQRANDIGENDLPSSAAASTDSSSSGDGSEGGVSGGESSQPSRDGWSLPIENGRKTSLMWHQQGSKGLHKGIDFPAPVGTPVTAAHDGKVTMVRNMGSCGWATAITAEGIPGIWHAHQHMDPTVKEGDTVKRGQRIGAVGKFCGTGHHLHFSIETASRVSAYADSGSKDTSKDPKGYIPL